MERRLHEFTVVYDEIDIDELGRVGELMPDTAPNLFVRETWLCSGVPHREDEPAITVRDRDNKFTFATSWLTHGKLHRLGGPAELGFYPGHSLPIFEAHYTDGLLHASGIPAQVERDGEGAFIMESWYQNGRAHRIGGPAYTRTHPTSGVILGETWFQKGRQYRPPNEGPSVVIRDEAGICEDLEFSTEGAQPTDMSTPTR